MKDTSVIGMFFELIRLGIGTAEKMQSLPTAQEWEQIYEISQKQTLLGIAFSGIEKLSAEQRPPKQLLLTWYNYCQKIKAANEKLNLQAVAIAGKFREEGFRNTILKGQGIAALYDNPARRTPGDVDIWLEGGREKILTYVKQFFPDCNAVYHHVDFPIYKHPEIEIHFTPSWMYNYFTNRRLQKFFAQQGEAMFTNRVTFEGCEGYINAPTLAFNRFYILLHIYRHLFQEGIGLRQLLDYYYVLAQGFTEEEKTETVKLLKQFRMKRFAGAVTYILEEFFAMDKKYRLVKPLEKEGEKLLKEILVSGNFGKYNPVYSNDVSDSLVSRAITRTKYNLQFMWSYPSEIFAAPLFRMWHHFWMKKTNK